MWFITDFLERTTRSFARTVVRIAAAEAEAQRRSLDAARARRALTGGLIVPDRSLCLSPTLALEHRVLRLPSEVPERQSALAHLVEATEAADATTATIAAARPGDVLAAIAASEDVVAALEEPIVVAFDAAAAPMGVRGDVVAKYVDAFARTARGEAAALIETLRKDKKVRVAELQLIAASVLGGDVVTRKKGEHLDALRRALVPAERRRAAPAEFAVHAG